MTTLEIVLKSIDELSEEELKVVKDKIEGRPEKLYGGKTLAELTAELRALGPPDTEHWDMVFALQSQIDEDAWK